MVQRKKKVDVTFELMSLLLRAGATGIVANARFADSQKWSQPGLHLAVQKLSEKGVVICTSNGHDKRVTIGSSIQSHSDWMLAYYGGEIPPRYQKYCTPTTPTVRAQFIDQDVPDHVRRIIEERDQLKKEVERLSAENVKMAEILTNELEALKKAIELMKKIRQ